MGNCISDCLRWLGCKFGFKVSKPQLYAHLYCPRDDSLADGLAEELRSALIHQSDTLNMNICHDATSLSDTMPTIVTCINSSRLGTNVSTAIKDLTLSPLHVVVILSHRDPGDADPEPSSRQLVDPKYKSIYGMIDMRFRSNQSVRLYQCEMNTRAISSMIRFIEENN